MTNQINLESHYLIINVSYYSVRSAVQVSTTSFDQVLYKYIFCCILDKLRVDSGFKTKNIMKYKKLIETGN